MAAGVDPDGKTTTRPQPHSITLEQHSVDPCEQPAHILDSSQIRDDNARSFSRERGEVANLNEYMMLDEGAEPPGVNKHALCRWGQAGTADGSTPFDHRLSTIIGRRSRRTTPARSRIETEQWDRAQKAN